MIIRKGLKLLDKLLIFILAFMGLGSCDVNEPAEYGTPNADYQFNGTITDSVLGSPLKNIRVISRSKENPLYGAIDTVYTGADGTYKIEFNDFAYTEFTLKIEDIDGVNNGGEFEAQEKSVTITSTDWVNKSQGDWYEGKAVKIVDIKMKPK
ncbi:MAG: hypothetical protein H6Q20_514 [Bacteroidetes bacterium]|nr:hypothetical protein [Bacteroidota bacterium]